MPLKRPEQCAADPLSLRIGVDGEARELAHRELPVGPRTKIALERAEQRQRTAAQQVRDEVSGERKSPTQDEAMVEASYVAGPANETHDPVALDGSQQNAAGIRSDKTVEIGKEPRPQFGEQSSLQLDFVQLRYFVKVVILRITA